MVMMKIMIMTMAMMRGTGDDEDDAGASDWGSTAVLVDSPALETFPDHLAMRGYSSSSSSSSPLSSPSSSSSSLPSEYSSRICNMLMQWDFVQGRCCLVG